jgi:hypothetical protein
MGVCAFVRKRVVEYYTEQGNNHTTYNEDVFVPWGTQLLSDEYEVMDEVMDEHLLTLRRRYTLTVL